MTFVKYAKEVVWDQSVIKFVKGLDMHLYVLVGVAERLEMGIIFYTKYAINMKKNTLILLLFVAITGTSFANIIEEYSDKLDLYHNKLITGGQMDVVVCRGELSKDEINSIEGYFSATPIEADIGNRNQIISKIEDLLKKRNSFSKKHLKHLYSPSGYKCILTQSSYGVNGNINHNNRIVSSKSKGLLSYYDSAKNTLSINEAPQSDWNSPSYFNFLIINPMMLDFKKLIFNNLNPDQVLKILPDGKDAVYIEGCVNYCEKIHIVLKNGFPCMDKSTYYESAQDRTVLRNIFYRFYKNIGDSDVPFLYPSFVIVIDAPRNNDLYKVEFYVIDDFKLSKIKDEEFEIQINKDTKILTDMN